MRTAIPLRDVPANTAFITRASYRIGMRIAAPNPLRDEHDGIEVALSGSVVPSYTCREEDFLFLSPAVIVDVPESSEEFSRTVRAIKNQSRARGQRMSLAVAAARAARRK